MTSDTTGQIEYEPEDSVGTRLAVEEQNDLLTVAQGGSVALIGTFASRGINYVYSATLIWGMGAENFGLFTLALAIIMFVGLLSNLGLSQGILRYGPIYAKTHGGAGIHRVTLAALRVALPIGLLVTLAILLSADFLASNIFNKPELAFVIRALGLSIPFMTLQSSLLAGTRSLKVIKYSVYVWFFQPSAALLLAIPLLVFGYGMPAVALSYVASYILGASLALYFYLGLIPHTRKTQERFPLGQMVKFSLPLSMTQWMHYLNERTEVFFLGLLPGAIDIGIYNIAWRIAGLETVFHLSLDQILAPISSDLSHRQALNQLDVLYKTTTKWAFTGALLLFLIFSTFSKTIMNFFDPAYVAGAGVLVALSFAQLINAGTGSCNTILIMSGYSNLSLLNTIVLLVVSIVLDWLLIPSHGLAGAAVAGAVAIILVNIMRVLEVWLTLKIQPFRWSFIKPIMAGLFGFAIIYILRTFVYSGGLFLDMLYALLFSVIYMVLIYLLKLDAEDEIVLRAVRRRLSGFRLGFIVRHKA